MERLNRNVGSIQTTFQQTPEILDSVCMDVLSNVSLKVIDYLVNVSILQVVVALKFIGVDFASRLYDFAHDLLSDVVFAIWNHLRPDLPAAHQHSHDNCFAAAALHSTIAAHALTLRSVHVSRLAADKCFVGFDWWAIRAA